MRRGATAAGATFWRRSPQRRRRRLETDSAPPFWRQRVPASSDAAERDRAAQRARSRANAAAIVSTMDDPFTVRRLAGDDADVMRPDHHHANSRTTGVGALARPVAREREATVALAEIGAQIGTAPGARIAMI